MGLMVNRCSRSAKDEWLTCTERRRREARPGTGASCETAFLMSSHRVEADDLRDWPKHRSSCPMAKEDRAVTTAIDAPPSPQSMLSPIATPSARHPAQRAIAVAISSLGTERRAGARSCPLRLGNGHRGRDAIDPEQTQSRFRERGGALGMRRPAPLIGCDLLCYLLIASSSPHGQASAWIDDETASCWNSPTVPPQGVGTTRHWTSSARSWASPKTSKRFVGPTELEV